MSIFLMNGICAEAADDVYKVGINDMLQIKVLEHPDLMTNSVVSSDGTITFPYLGAIYVKDKKITDIEEEIEILLGEGYVKFPSVSVTLMQSMSRKIFTYGEVMVRGQIGFEDNMTLMNALSLAGGVSKDGLYGNLILKRKDEGKSGYKVVVSTRLNDGLIESAKVRNKVVKVNDILIVEKNDTFLVQGKVSTRGRFALEKGMTVLKALLLAGGVSTDGYNGSIKLRRKKDDASGYTDVAEARIYEGVIESSDVEDIPIKSDDILIVEGNKTIYIQGEVMSRGQFVLQKDFTLLNAILTAGGATDRGYYGKIKLRRKVDGKYTDIAESMLNNGIFVNSDIESTMLEPNDIVVVEQNDTYFVYGEVPRPAEYTLKGKMTVFEAIILAGGFTKWGSADAVEILRTTGQNQETIEVNIEKVIEGHKDADVYIEPGDKIIVSAGGF